jgi:hypothetical protein
MVRYKDSSLESVPMQQVTPPSMKVVALPAPCSLLPAPCFQVRRIIPHYFEKGCKLIPRFQLMGLE